MSTSICFFFELIFPIVLTGMTKQAETRTDFGHVTQTFHVKLLLFHMHNEQKRAFPLIF